MGSKAGEGAAGSSDDVDRPDAADAPGSVTAVGGASMRSLVFDRLEANATVLDGAGVIVDTNAGWRLFAHVNGGSPSATGVGANYLDECDRAAAVGSVDGEQVAHGLRDLLAGGRDRFDFEYPCASPAEDRWYLLQASAAPISAGAGAIVVHADITARKVLEQGLASFAGHDGSTGLASRSAARDHLAEQLARGLEVAVIVLDLDDLEGVNIRHGRHAGDELLVKVAMRIRRVVGGGGLVARLGGDEFVVLGTGPGWDPTRATSVAEAIRDEVARPFQIGSQLVSVGVSAGIARSDEQVDGDQLLQLAEARLHDDKQRGADRRRRLAELADVLPARTAEAGPPVEDVGPDPALVAQLRASQALTDAVLAHSSDLVIFFDGDGTMDWVSPPVVKLFGVASSTLIGRNGFELIHPDDRDRVLTDFLTIPNLGDSVRTEFRILVGDEIRWVEEIATNLLDEPHVGQIVGNLRDVTDRRTADEAVVFQATLLAAAGQAIVASDPEGRVLYWNAAAEVLYGWSSAEAIGQSVRRLVPLADSCEPPPEATASLVGSGTWNGELTVVTKAGHEVPVMVTSRPVSDAAGQRVATTFVSFDITERVERRQRDEEAHRRLADAQASAQLGSFEVDLSTGEVLRSLELYRILGLDPGTLSGVDFGHIHPEDQAMVRQAYGAAARGESDVSCTHRIVRPDGTVRWVLSRTSPQDDSAPEVLAGTMLDITERHEAELALAHQAGHDPLTGLANRRLLVDALEASLERAEATGRRTGVVFIDLDDFKVVNDRFGHVDGDEILRAVGELFEGVAGDGDTVARLGGDEYVVCCDDVDDVADLQARVERLQRSLAAPFRVGGRSHTLTASIGMVLSSPGVPAETLLRNADAAMYAAKQAGGARSESFDDALYAEQRRHQELAAELAAGLEAGQVETHFQPEVAVRTGALVGFEALARWHHPERGAISPAEFIEVAEAGGLIGQLGRQVLADGCCALASWLAGAPERPLSVAINVSPVQLADPTFPDDVRNAIRAAGVPAGRVCLEVTESALMDPDLAAEALRSLKAIGVTIAIDDFGTGYSSLSRLKRFPVDLLKIDRSFVDGLGSDPEDEVIVATVVNLARSLGIDVIAEGVETQEQLDVLAGYGCELAQGYLWSPALAPAEAARYAASRQPRQRAGATAGR